MFRKYMGAAMNCHSPSSTVDAQNTSKISDDAAKQQFIEVKRIFAIILALSVALFIPAFTTNYFQKALNAVEEIETLQQYEVAINSRRHLLDQLKQILYKRLIVQSLARNKDHDAQEILNSFTKDTKLFVPSPNIDTWALAWSDSGRRITLNAALDLVDGNNVNTVISYPSFEESKFEWLSADDWQLEEVQVNSYTLEPMKLRLLWRHDNESKVTQIETADLATVVVPLRLLKLQGMQKTEVLTEMPRMEASQNTSMGQGTQIFPYLVKLKGSPLWSKIENLNLENAKTYMQRLGSGEDSFSVGSVKIDIRSIIRCTPIIGMALFFILMERLSFVSQLAKNKRDSAIASGWISSISIAPLRSVGSLVIVSPMLLHCQLLWRYWSILGEVSRFEIVLLATLFGALTWSCLRLHAQTISELNAS
ncbi:hypothetical protein SH528x_006434 [Novipirellula sp. SH528]|uniref:hypothetical protein n=1 Tax=Novipirellula sp. SH528 TaxID=3454466 RepID=UPI003F9EC013